MAIISKVEDAKMKLNEVLTILVMYRGGEEMDAYDLRLMVDAVQDAMQSLNEVSQG